jgi:hypothetical protein
MLVYDGDCGFCTRCARWVETRARHVEVVPWQALDLRALGLSEQQVRTAAYWPDDGTTDHGERAIARSLMACGRGFAVIGRALLLPAYDGWLVWAIGSSRGIAGVSRDCLARRMTERLRAGQGGSSRLRGEQPRGAEWEDGAPRRLRPRPRSGEAPVNVKTRDLARTVERPLGDAFPVPLAHPSVTDPVGVRV